MTTKKQDKSHSIKPIDNFTPKKKQTLKAVDYMEKSKSARATEKRLTRLMHCGSFLEFVSDVDKDKHKLINANFCKDRFCPMCQWRNAAKESYSLSVMMTAIEDELNYKFIFLTLTVKNVDGKRLDSEIKLLNRAFAKLIKRVNRKNEVLKGYVRKLEVTYNKERNDYHPHIHAIIAVNKSYFTSRDYINQKKWLQMWREVTGKTAVDEFGRDEISQLNVQKVKDVNESALEVGKYTIKSVEYLDNQEVFDLMLHVLHGKRLIAFGGCFKEYRDKYKKDELNQYIEIDLTDYVYRLWMYWKPEINNYKKEYVEMSENAKIAYNTAIRNKENLREINEI